MTERKTGYSFAILGWILGGFILFILMILAYWALDRRSPIANVQSHFVKWDEETPNLLWIKRTGVRVRYCHGEVYRWLIGPVVAPLPTSHMPYPQELGPFEDQIAVEVPEWAKLIRFYRVNLRYVCNPIHNLVPINIEVPDVPIPRRPGANGRPIPEPPKDTSG